MRNHYEYKVFSHNIAQGDLAHSLNAAVRNTGWRVVCPLPSVVGSPLEVKILLQREVRDKAIYEGEPPTDYMVGTQGAQ